MGQGGTARSQKRKGNEAVLAAEWDEQFLEVSNRPLEQQKTLAMEVLAPLVLFMPVLDCLSAGHCARSAHALHRLISTTFHGTDSYHLCFADKKLKRPEVQ